MIRFLVLLQTFIFQSRFEDLVRRAETYESGQKIFGLKVSEYPVLNQRKKDINLLSKLYSLYLLVLKRIDGYAEMQWASVDMVEIIAEVTDFQSRCRKLPKGMYTWPAFIDLKQKIDDFNETCPLLELMTADAMKERHWQQMSELVKYNFDITNPKTTLGYVLEAPLLNYKDDIQVRHECYSILIQNKIPKTHIRLNLGHLRWC